MLKNIVQFHVGTAQKYQVLGKGGRSGNKLRKSQNRKFADLNNLLDLRTFR
jgi:hypothetical protein